MNAINKEDDFLRLAREMMDPPTVSIDPFVKNFSRVDAFNSAALQLKAPPTDRLEALEEAYDRVRKTGDALVAAYYSMARQRIESLPVRSDVVYAAAFNAAATAWRTNIGFSSYTLTSDPFWSGIVEYIGKRYEEYQESMPQSEAYSALLKEAIQPVVTLLEAQPDFCVGCKGTIDNGNSRVVLGEYVHDTPRPSFRVPYSTLASVFLTYAQDEAYDLVRELGRRNEHFYLLSELCVPTANRGSDNAHYEPKSRKELYSLDMELNRKDYEELVAPHDVQGKLKRFASKDACSIEHTKIKSLEGIIVLAHAGVKPPDWDRKSAYFTCPVEWVTTSDLNIGFSREF